MGLLDNVLGSGVPGRNISKPLMIGLAALLAAHVTRSGGLGSLLEGPGTSASTPPTAPAAAPGQPQSGLLGGLAGMLQRFQQSGHSDVINSWIGPGQNQPIAPDQLHQALGPEAVNNLARLTGLPQNELVSELSRVLPGVVDKLTPQGRMPDQAEMSRHIIGRTLIRSAGDWQAIHVVLVRQASDAEHDHRVAATLSYPQARYRRLTRSCRSRAS
jgi:uncharacterized protein YidB (DUF937 family)